MEYVLGSNLRDYLKNNYRSLNLENKLSLLESIIKGLERVHSKNLIHCDFHPGNILNRGDKYFSITDLGLCRPVNETDNSKIYGSLPYVAPEVLEGKIYAQASDVYSFGIVAYEVLSGLPPYYSYAHDANLFLRILDGLRPQFFARVKIPPLLEDLIDRCWDADPKQRPAANEIWSTLVSFRRKNSEFAKQLQEAEEVNKSLPQEIRFSEYENHPQAIYVSRLLDFKNLSGSQNNKEINNQFSNLSSYDLSLELKFQSTINKKFHNDNSELTNELDIEARSINKNSAKYVQNQDWQDLHPFFTPQLSQSWTKHNFTHQQTRDWINAGLTPNDANFATWLQGTKQVSAEWVLNHGNLEQLNQEFFTWWQQNQFRNQQEQPPK